MNLDEIQARAAAATPGPWWAEEEDVMHWMRHYEDCWAFKTDLKADARFIAHARTDVPRLVAALRAVEALCDAPADEKGVEVPRYWVAVHTIRAAIRDALDGETRGA